MGLDMYLQAKIHFSDYFEAEHPIRAEIDKINWPGQRSSYKDAEVKVTCGYWRKANHIHSWFVQNVQNGVDDCGNYYVSVDQIRELSEICAEILLNKDPAKAKQLLPPQSGFFFGGTDIDEWYWESVQETFVLLTEILDHPSRDKFDYEYHSSW